MTYTKKTLPNGTRVYRTVRKKQSDQALLDELRETAYQIKVDNLLRRLRRLLARKIAEDRNS